MARTTLFCLIVCIFCLQLAFASPLISMDAMKARNPDISKQANDAIELLKYNFEQLVKTVKNNDMFKDFNEKIKKLGDEIVVQGQQIVEDNIK